MADGVNYTLVEYRDFVRVSEKVQSQTSSTGGPATMSELRISARALNQIAGIELLWTSDLQEHLKYDPLQRTLSLFRHGSFLRTRRDSGYSAEYLRETAMTLTLLFLYGKPPNRRWHRRIRKRAEPDVEIGLSTNPNRDVQKYKYWSRQLVIVQSAFDSSSRIV